MRRDELKQAIKDLVDQFGKINVIVILNYPDDGFTDQFSTLSPADQVSLLSTGIKMLMEEYPMFFKQRGN